MKKQDMLLILLVCVAALAVFLGYRLWNRGTGEDVVVYIEEEEAARFALQTDTEYEILSADGGSNHLSIQNGQADVTQASCPDKVCVHQETISQTGQTIVCMPNRVIVTIESASQKNKR